MDNRQTAFVGLSFLALGLMIGLIFSEGANTSNSIINSDTGGPESQSEFISVSEDDDPFIGDPDAPVVIVEFSDYQCPYCAKFQTETLPEIVEEYVDKGLVKLVFRDFPIPSHPDATTAAVAAECVGEQGGDEAYFDMHDMIFERMVDWYYSEDIRGEFISYADELGYEIETCMDDPAMLAEVEDDYIAGRSYGVQGTPTFFINGKKLVGAYPFSHDTEPNFQDLIESEL